MGLLGGGTQAKLASKGYNQQGGGSSYQNYMNKGSGYGGGEGGGGYTGAANTYMPEAWDAVKNLATAYTPQQVMQMKSNVTNQQAAQNSGGYSRIRELMAAQGLSGSGSETGAVSNFMLNNARNVQNATSGIDINNANQGLQNAYAKSGLLNQLAGLGENARQFDWGLGENARQFNVGNDSNMYRWGTEFDYGKRQDSKSQDLYQKYLEMMLKGGQTGSTSTGGMAQAGGFRSMSRG